MKPRHRTPIICLLLILATGAVYMQTLRFDLLSWDDQERIIDNPYVHAGFTLDTVKWAFARSDFGHHWNPLTWMSHTLDWQIFSRNPAGHHLVNLLLHTANTLLLFTVFARTTRAPWRSAFVAALFALHPLHVEPVAWVSGRSYLLGCFFLLVTLWSYVAWVNLGGKLRYLRMLLLFTLALMAKPLLVVVPVLMLMCDYWPLQRTPGSRRFPDKRTVHRSAARLLKEKIPLYLLAIAAAMVTLLLHASSVTALAASKIDLPLRLANAAVSYVPYLGKAFWPAELSPFYPHPYLPAGVPWTTGQIISCTAVLAAITMLVIVFRRKRYLLVGWLWFVLTLLPVIGLVQVGQQAMADRYGYVALIGLFIMIAWGCGELVTNWPAATRLLRPVVVTAAVAAIIACATASWFQSQVWRSSIALYRHAVRTTANSPIMHNNLGIELKSQSRFDDAMRHYRRAIDLAPDYAQAHNNLANMLNAYGQRDKAISHYRVALKARPDLAPAHTNLANALVKEGKYDEAINHYQQTLRLFPKSKIAKRMLAEAQKLKAESHPPADPHRSAAHP